MDGIIVKAVKESINEELDSYWALHLPNEQKDAYYKGFSEDRRERGDESRDYLIVQTAHRVLREQGVRGLCFR